MRYNTDLQTPGPEVGIEIFGIEVSAFVDITEAFRKSPSFDKLLEVCSLSRCRAEDLKTLFRHEGQCPDGILDSFLSGLDTAIDGALDVAREYHEDPKGQLVNEYIQSIFRRKRLVQRLRTGGVEKAFVWLHEFQKESYRNPDGDEPATNDAQSDVGGGVAARMFLARAFWSFSRDLYWLYVELRHEAGPFPQSLRDHLRILNQITKHIEKLRTQAAKTNGDQRIKDFRDRLDRFLKHLRSEFLVPLESLQERHESGDAGSELDAEAESFIRGPARNISYKLHNECDQAWRDSTRLLPPHLSRGCSGTDAQFLEAVDSLIPAASRLSDEHLSTERRIVALRQGIETGDASTTVFVAEALAGDLIADDRWRAAIVFAAEDVHFPVSDRNNVCNRLLSIADEDRKKNDSSKATPYVVYSALRRGASLLPVNEVHRLLPYLNLNESPYVDTRLVALQSIATMYEVEPGAERNQEISDGVSEHLDHQLATCVFSQREGAAIAYTAIHALASMGDDRLKGHVKKTVALGRPWLLREVQKRLQHMLEIWNEKLNNEPTGPLPACDLVECQLHEIESALAAARS